MAPPRLTPSAKSRSKRRSRRGWLLVVLGLAFATSGVLRLGALEGAWATQPERPSEEMPLNGATERLRTAFEEVDALRARLEERETALTARETAVAAAQTLVETRLAELEDAEARLERLIAVSDSAAETDLDQLTRVYETMAPEEAAPLFEQMEPSFAAGFLSRMTPPNSAALLAELDPPVAYAISVVLATRNAAAPTLPEPGPEATGGDTEN